MNKEEIDKWLDNEYGVSYTSLEEIHDWLVDENIKKDKEIKRLNNIINELEKWVEIRLESCYQLEIDYNLNSKIEILEEIERKIEELKGVDKE